MSMSSTPTVLKNLAFWIPIVIVAADAAAASLPKSIQGASWYRPIRAALDFLAMNFGKSKNKED